MEEIKEIPPVKMSVSVNEGPGRDKIISAPPAFRLRLLYFISAWAFKSGVALGIRLRRLLSGRLIWTRPEIRSYPIRPFLRNRIFLPKDCENDKPLPLYLDIHGGGWVAAAPLTDDKFCSFLAQKFKIIVVSVDYRKGPLWRFPYAVEDIVAIVDAVMQDESLNIDETKVALGGFSAGGNLAFAAAQVETLRGRLSALVGFYPCLDLTETLTEKLQRRPPGAGSDLLESMATFLDWAYVPDGADRRDPLLSPRWAKREDLPPCVYLVGAEYDMLCYEAQQMAESLARPEDERIEVPGMLIEDGWAQGGIRWECARGRLHAFTHAPVLGKNGVERMKAVQEMYCRVGAWLTKEVWAN